MCSLQCQRKNGLSWWTNISCATCAWGVIFAIRWFVSNGVAKHAAENTVYCYTAIKMQTQLKYRYRTRKRIFFRFQNCDTSLKLIIIIKSILEPLTIYTRWFDLIFLFFFWQLKKNRKKSYIGLSPCTYGSNLRKKNFYQ